MPLYTYEIVNKDGSSGESFETMHSSDAPPLTKHPDTGQPVRRVYTPVHIAGSWNSRVEKARLQDGNLERNGFTKYVKDDDGSYRRTVGKQGPAQIRKPQD